MARKSATTTTDKTDRTQLKKGICKNLLGTAEIEYEIADTPDGTQIRLSNYSSSGYYSKAWIGLDSILESLEAFASNHPLVSLALKDAYPANTSVSSWSFMMAVLLAEGLVERLEDNKRHFRPGDPAPFLASIEQWKAPHRSPSNRNPRAKSKPASRMQKATSKAANSK